MGILIMYVFEFLKRMFRKSNTTVVIYLIINYILISAIIGLLFSGGGGGVPREHPGKASRLSRALLAARGRRRGRELCQWDGDRHAPSRGRDVRKRIAS